MRVHSNITLQTGDRWLAEAEHKKWAEVCHIRDSKDSQLVKQLGRLKPEAAEEETKNE